MSKNDSNKKMFISSTVIAALTAAMATASSMTFSLPVWAMFIGWIAFYTRGINAKAGLENLGCVGMGLVFGLCAALTLSNLAPAIGSLPFMNNLLCYFLGLVSWFAAHLEPSLESLLFLFSASVIGTLAGLASHHLPLLLFYKEKAI